MPRTREVGIAIATRCILAVGVRDNDSSEWSAGLAAPDPAGHWPDLEAALRELREALGGPPARISVALMPDLVSIRAIELPFMRKAELLRVLQRDAGRYFFRVRDEQVVAVSHVQRSRARRTVLAATASRWLLEVLAEALTNERTCVRQVVPAHAAWAAAFETSGQSRPGVVSCLVVPCEESIELLSLRGGRLLQIRRAGSHASETVLKSVAGPHPVSIDRLIEGASALPVAARFAPRAAFLSLVAPSVERQELRYWRRIATGLAATAAGLLLTTGLLRAVDLRRELAHVQSMRQELRAHVIPAAQARSSVEAMQRRVKLLCQLRDDPTRWSNVLVTVAEHLPLDAYLTELSAASDTVALEGVALRASEALTELRTAPGIRSLHATAPIRREANGGEDQTEHFTVALRLEAQKERQ
jgi:hypothetical protein